MVDIFNPSAEPAVGDLWEIHSSELVRFATLLVGRSDAPDIVSSAFERLTTVPTDTIVLPRAFLFRAVRNEAINVIRQRSRRQAREFAAAVAAESAIPSNDSDVVRAVAGLSLQQRTVVYFAYWEDLTEPQIAEVLAVSPGTVRRQLARARSRLRKELS